MTSARPLLTVVLTSYNYARHVPGALRALEAQIGPDARLLIIDDGSTDDSPALLRGRAERNPYITLEANPVNTGIHAVLNQGLALVRSPWVLYSAMDDVAYPDLIGRLTALLRRYPRAGLCTAPAEYLDAAGARPLPWIGPDLPDNAWCSPEAAAALMRRYGFWFAGMTTAFSVRALRAAGGFDASLGPLADAFVSQVVALRHGMATAARPLAGVRQARGGYSRATLDPALATLHRRNALARMEALPDLFPPSFRRDWEDFTRIWDGLRAWKHGVGRRRAPSRAASTAPETGRGATGCGLPSTCVAAMRLWRNPLFRVRVSGWLRHHCQQILRRGGRA